ncbi:GDP-mannose-dependent alpha-mannosyltransferase [Streptomyces sp. RB5]|uniref:GDP-mannose-dependent alpha-mannosyltransferase n=1 Tax=Streptomyces smaragdinus TaxID=2585196 RepID=A0A7K0CN51_9ACTN|nr:glycosyltransferase family 1 protein [Streptomyces smaragdinus]MQY14908.1 GDP-mannose-dependent alpha-mannosyltransferase [Streptomyces smaragdinus]
MRIAVVTESFPPDINGVAHCAQQTVRHLVRRGHDVLVVAPAAPQGASEGPPPPCRVVRLPAVSLPGYPQVRLALPSRRLAAELSAHRAELVHLASPFVLGARGAAVATRLGIPSVAVYQTDLGSYARTYMGAGEALAWRRIRTVHTAAAVTLAPSSAAMALLAGHGVPRVRMWPRGVDSHRFHPARRDEELRRGLAGGAGTLVGYVGRLAPEKHVELMSLAARLPDVRVVVAGDGPSAPALRESVPGARFLGMRTGDELARIYASLDMFVHTGPFETFCQTVQEAMASGVPVIAPAAGGPLDLVAHERTGLLVPPMDAGAVRDAVQRLTDAPELRAEFGRAGRAAVAARTWEAVGDQLIGCYEEVLARRTAVAA